MYKLKWFSICILILSFSFAAHAQQVSSRLSGFDIPVAGSTLSIQYNPQGGPLAAMDKIAGIVYMFNDYTWQVGDLALLNDNGLWKGTFDVPKNCAFIAFKMVSEASNNSGIFDNNDDNGFVYTTVDDNKGRLPGGALAWGIFRKPSVGKSIPGYYQKFDIMDEALEMWVSKEMQAYSSNITKFFDSFIAMVKLRSGSNFPKAAKKFIPVFLSNPALREPQYMDVLNLYKFDLKDSLKADSLSKVILDKYPKGGMVRFLKYNEVFKMPLDAKKITASEKFLQDFPIQAWNESSEFKYQKFIYLNTYRNLASAYFASNQFQKLIALIPDMDFVTLNEVYHWNIDRAFKLKLLAQDKIYVISDALINEMIKKAKDLSYMDGTRYSPKQAVEQAQKELDAKLSTHIVLLNSMAKYADALNYINYLSDKAKFKNADVNDAHVNSLQKNGREAEVLAVIESGMKANEVTGAMFDYLKKDYIRKNGSEVGYDKYQESLKSADNVKEQKANLKLVKVKATDFKLSGMDGLSVNSEDFKGKIVVLDFWATWCFPCKKSFPGMQLLVERYAKDPKVDLYFIATMEAGKNYKNDISKYIKSSKYDFKVLYDGFNNVSKNNDAVFSTFVPLVNSSAIPRKVVLKDGYMRYTSEGYSGSPSLLMDEISYVIEQLKAEK